MNDPSWMLVSRRPVLGIAAVMGVRAVSSSAVGRVDLGDHVCAPGGSAYDQASGLVEYALAGVRSGQRVLLYTDNPPPLEVTTTLLRRMSDADQVLSREQVVIKASRDRYRQGNRLESGAMVANLRSEVDAALRAGYSGLRIADDLTWTGPDTVDLEALLDYESRANSEFAGGGLLGVCRYDPRRYPPEQWQQVAAVHPVTMGEDGAPSAHMSGRRTRGGLRLHGETDLTNHRAFTTLVETALPLPDCVIDATGLSFIDAAGTGALIRLALARRDRPTTIITSPTVARLLDLLGAGTVAGLTVLVEPSLPAEATR